VFERGVGNIGWSLGAAGYFQEDSKFDSRRPHLL